MFQQSQELTLMFTLDMQNTRNCARIKYTSGLREMIENTLRSKIHDDAILVLTFEHLLYYLINQNLFSCQLFLFFGGFLLYENNPIYCGNLRLSKQISSYFHCIFYSN